MRPPAPTRGALLLAAKIALTLGALALLSTMFLVSRSPHEAVEGAAPPGPGDTAGMLAPRYSGVTRDGAALSIAARTARPGAAGRGASATALRADIALPDGRKLSLAAGAGRVTPEGDRAILEGGVRAQSDDGLDLTAPRAEIALDRIFLIAEGGVDGQTPQGRIRAERMELRPDPAAPEDHIIIFKGDVRLLYDPSTHPEAAP